MADAEVQILIRAVDDASKTLKDIEKNVESTAKNSEKANQSLSKSFTQVQGAMLNLGQVAQGIHNIFEIHERATRNLENATDRLQNAELRLMDVQDRHRNDILNIEKAELKLKRSREDLIKLNKQLGDGAKYVGDTQREYEDSLLAVKQAESDLTFAQEAHSRQLDDLTIAQNNVDRAQRGLNKTVDDAKWAYVDMGVQAISVAGNLGVLAFSVKSLGGSLGVGGLTTSAGFATTALGPIGLAGIMAGIIALPLAAHVIQISEQAKAYDTLGYSAEGAAIRVRDLNDEMDRTTGTGGTRITSPEPVELPKGWKIIDNLDKSITDMSTKKMPAFTTSVSTNFTQMATISNKQIETINVSLDSIPRDIFTYHHIVTVYD